MPKVVIYIRQSDAAAIEKEEGKTVEDWVRGLVKHGIERWKEKQSS
jgi:hypothetical protein